MSQPVAFGVPRFIRSTNDKLIVFCFLILFTLESDGGPSSRMKKRRTKDDSGGEEKPPVDEKEEQAKFDAHVEANVTAMLKEYTMEVEEKSRKRKQEEANAMSEDEGWMTSEEFVAAQQESKFYMNEDDGIQIPGVHPFYNLPVNVQLMILDLPGKTLDDVLDYISKNAPQNSDNKTS